MEGHVDIWVYLAVSIVVYLSVLAPCKYQRWLFSLALFALFCYIAQKTAEAFTDSSTTFVFGLSVLIGTAASALVIGLSCLKCCPPAVFNTIAFIINTGISSTFFAAAVFSIDNSEDELIDLSFRDAAPIAVLVVLAATRVFAWWLLAKYSKRCKIKYDELHDADSDADDDDGHSIN